jgi:hypothetical protein
VSFASITLCVASQRVIPKVRVYFFIDSVRKLLDTTVHSPDPLLVEENYVTFTCIISNVNWICVK